MATIKYQCVIIGDGKSPETAFRPSINDIKDARGNPAFPHSDSPPTDQDGKPIGATMIVKTDDKNAALAVGKPGITPVAIGAE